MIQITDHEGQLIENPLSLNTNELTVFIGGNNSGKSTILRSIVRRRDDAYLVNVNRTILRGEGARDKNYFESKQGFVNQVRDAQDDNLEQKNVQILQDIFNLKDPHRQQIIDYYNSHFPNEMVEELEDPENTASPHQLKMNGFSITKQGSGARSMLEILVKLFDPTIKILCIDEPEIALEPKLQKSLFRAIKDKAGIDKQIFISTHSHHFLDRTTINNNHICARNDDGKIYLAPIETELQLRNAIFNLLGNDLKDLGLPERLIIVEGISDVKFIKKALELLDKKEYSVYDSGSDSKIKTAAEGISAYLKYVTDLATVYGDRIWILSDVQSHDTRVRGWRTALDDQANKKGRVKVLAKNGVEYYYPERLLQEIFQTTDLSTTIIDGYLRNNPNSYNSIIVSKRALCEKIVAQLSLSDLEETNEIAGFLRTLPN